MGALGVDRMKVLVVEMEENLEVVNVEFEVRDSIVGLLLDPMVDLRVLRDFLAIYCCPWSWVS